MFVFKIIIPFPAGYWHLSTRLLTKKVARVSMSPLSPLFFITKHPFAVFDNAANLVEKLEKQIILPGKQNLDAIPANFSHFVCVISCKVVNLHSEKRI